MKIKNPRIMLIKDLELLLGSLISSVRRGNGKFYWDDCPEHEFNNLITEIDNPNDNERKIIRRFLAEAGAKSLLDASCGSATELRSYRENGLDVKYSGMDKSARMLELSRKNFPDADLSRGDVNCMPFPNGSFDAVVLKHVLEHLKSYDLAVQEVLRVSRKAVIISFFHRLLPGNADLIIRNNQGYYDNWFSRNNFDNFLDNLGAKYKSETTSGINNQTATIYLISK